MDKTLTSQPRAASNLRRTCIEYHLKNLIATALSVMNKLNFVTFLLYIYYITVHIYMGEIFSDGIFSSMQTNEQIKHNNYDLYYFRYHGYRISTSTKTDFITGGVYLNF